ncbi:DUF1648 domain-containing protein [Microbacterium arabinogalactanolyticum]|uniref:DUF1648 domain-containing protein n=1 Tax=Microbacterium arabinogalactanolyticum TaxID=69365 RepID=UPI00255447E5|nr:DUF1648 domain-containing protein [Microbacterium arabinogalactanolyticum]GLC85094.1 hypothetical protein MIAR_16810 [Microbacterium arabinogalactanolyticum]
MTSASVDERRRGGGIRWVGLIVPLATLLVGAIVVVVLLPHVPDPAAVHWSGDGRPDGFASPWLNLLPVGIGVVLVILFAWLARALPRLQQTRPGPAALSQGPAPTVSTARFLAAVNLGLAVMLTVISVASMGVQLGVADAADAPDISGWAAVGSACAVVATLAGWFAQPAASDGDQRAESVEPSASGRTEWSGSVVMARSGQVLLGIGVLITVALTGVLVARASLTGSWGSALLMIGVTALLLLAVGTSLVFRVRVTTDGLRVRSIVGLPSTRIRLSDIAKVEVLDVDPLRDFGGWGWRIAVDGRRGVVLRAGRALQITRISGRRFAVTVDGADDAAAVLEGLRRASSAAR